MTTFVEVKALKNIFEVDEDDASWQQNLRDTGLDGDLDVSFAHDEEADDFVYGDFEEGDMRYVMAATFYNFMGGPCEQERFYPADYAVYKSEDGRLWVENCEELGLF